MNSIFKLIKFYLVLKSYLIGLLLIGLQETGWMPRHIVAKDESENILCVVPLYLKRFSIYSSLFLNLFTVDSRFVYYIFYATC